MRLPDLNRLVRPRAKGPGLTRDEALSAVPLRNPAITWELQENGRVLLTVPLQLKPWMRALKAIIQVPAEKRVELDELGSDVWQWCDGEADVRLLVKRFARAHKLNEREAEVSLTQFLQTLARRRFIGFAVEMDEARAAEVRQDGKRRERS